MREGPLRKIANAGTSFEPVMLPEYRKLYEINSDISGMAEHRRRAAEHTGDAAGQ